MKKFLSLILAASMCAGVLSGCGSQVSDTTNPDKEASLTVMTINGEAVSSEELAGFLCYEKNIYESYFGAYMGDSSSSTIWDDETMRQQVEDAAYNEICYGYAIQSLAEELGIEMDKSGKDKMEQIKEQYYTNLATEATSTQEAKSGEQGYVEYINSMGFSQDMFDKLLENSVLLEKITDYYYGANGTEKITEDAIQDYYNDNYYHVKHILISNTDDDGNERADGGLSIAKEVVSKLQAGASFDDLMEQYNTDTGEPEDGYTFSENDSFVQEFKDASKALEINKYTVEPVQSTYGYHIIMRLPLSEDTLNAATGSVSGGKIYDEIEQSMEDIDSKINAALEKLDIQKTEDYDKVNMTTFHKYTQVQVEGIQLSEESGKTDTDAEADSDTAAAGQDTENQASSNEE